MQLHQVDIRTTPHICLRGASQPVCSGESSFSKCMLDSATSHRALSRNIRGWRDVGLIRGNVMTMRGGISQQALLGCRHTGGEVPGVGGPPELCV